MSNRRCWDFGRLYVSLIFTLVSLILSILIIISGIRSNVLLDNYFLQVDVSNLQAPSKLSGSEMLSDISKISGGDWVGPNVTASSMGLAKTYTISLLTSCAHQSDGSVVCSAPRFGFNFDPAIDLNLQGPLGAGLPQDYSKQANWNGQYLRWIAIAYTIGGAANALSLLLLAVAGCFNPVNVLNAVLAAVSTIFLLAASIASLVKYQQIRDWYNGIWGNVGATTTLGLRAYVLSFVAFVFALLAMASLIHRLRTAKRYGKHALRPYGYPYPSRELDLAHSEVGVPGAAPSSSSYNNEPKGPGFLGRLPTWKRHRYAQIEKQPMIQHQHHEHAAARSVGVDSDRTALVGADDEFSHDYLHEDVVLGMPPKHTTQAQRNLHDSSTAYDPHARSRSRSATRQ